MKFRCIALAALAVAASAAQADVQVNFVKSDEFSDIRDNQGFREKEVLDDIKAYLVTQLQKRLPGKDVRVDVTDVDLAGEYEPFFWRSQGVRVMRSYTAPSIELSYEVREGDKVVQQGKTRLRDLNYQDGFNLHNSGESLRYEKRMLDRWMQREFATAVAAAPAR
jgi:predicted Zn-dependent protease